MTIFPLFSLFQQRISFPKCSLTCTDEYNLNKAVKVQNIRMRTAFKNLFFERKVLSKEFFSLAPFSFFKEIKGLGEVAKKK